MPGHLLLLSLALWALQASAQPSCGYTASVSQQQGSGACHQSLLRAVSQASTGAVTDLVLYGDSILEAFRGTKLCSEAAFEASTYGAGSTAEAAFQQFFGQYKALNLAVAGDTTGNLLWRVQHGAALTARPPRVAVVYIGTNDLLGASYSCRGADGLTGAAAGIAASTEQVVEAIRAASPGTRIILMGLWPHGGPGGIAATWPNRLSGAVAALNADLQAYAAATPGASYLDCGGAFVQGSQLTDLASDNLHPNSAGFAAVAACLAPAVAAALGTGAGQAPAAAAAAG